jgi:MarR family transcriptional regulator, organic hydroperoxide resistance regulator
LEYNDKDLKLAGEVVQSFVGINKAIVKFTQQNASSLGLTVPQLGILNMIRSRPGLTLKNVTELLSLPKSTVSMAVDGLVNLGLVEREPSQEDRREVHVNATARGKEISQKSIENSLSYKAMAAALEKLPEEDIQLLVRIHNDLLASLKQTNLLLPYEK